MVGYSLLLNHIRGAHKCRSRSSKYRVPRSELQISFAYCSGYFTRCVPCAYAELSRLDTLICLDTVHSPHLQTPIKIPVFITSYTFQMFMITKLINTAIVHFSFTCPSKTPTNTVHWQSSNRSETHLHNLDRNGNLRT